MSRIYLPAWSTLIGAGWLLGRYWDQIIDWFDVFLDDPDLPPMVIARCHVRVMDRPFDFEVDA